MRYSHILSSAVREVLEVNLLKEVSPPSLNLTQFHLLKLMTFDGMQKLCELASVLGMSRPAATKNIDKLEGLGLVSREPDAEDRRAMVVKLSFKGHELVRRVEDLRTEAIGSVIEDFDKEEIETLSELIERLSVSLLRNGEPGQEVCLRCAAYIEDDCAIGELCGGCPYRKYLESQQEGGD